MQSKKVSPASNDFDIIDDYIGIESCVDLKSHHAAADMLPPPMNFSGGISKRGGGMRRDQDQDEYPPPIPLLVRTENLSNSHMPWVLKRHYTADGRLVLTEERVTHHEFFRAHRSDGRLMLQLVAVDDQVSDESDVGLGDDGGGCGGVDCAAAEGGENDGGGGKRCKYGNVSGIRDAGFVFGVAVPEGSPEVCSKLREMSVNVTE